MTTRCCSCGNFLHAPSGWCRSNCRCIRTAPLYCAGRTGIRALTFPFGSGDARGVCRAMASRDDFSFCADRCSSCDNSGAQRGTMGGLDVLINLCHTFGRSDHDGCSLPRCSRPAPAWLPHVHASGNGWDHRANFVDIRQAKCRALTGGAFEGTIQS